MTRLLRLPVLLAVMMIAMMALVACGCAADTAEPAAGAPAQGEEQQRLTVSGAFALFPMMTVWGDAYQSANSGVGFDITGGGAGKGMTDMLSGVADIAMVSRELKQEEIDQGAFGVPVTIDAVVATVNADNPYLDQILATGLTPEKAAAIWMSQEAKTWGDVLGTDAAEAVTVYTRSDAAGAAEVWAKYMGGTAQEDLLGTAVNGDPGLAEAVRQDRLGIGYNNIGFAYDLSTGQQLEGLRVVPLDLNGDGQISADEDFYGTKDDIAAAIAAKQYPFPPARELYLVTKGAPGPAIADLYRWILTDGQALVPDAGYVSLSPERIQAALEMLNQ